MNRLVRLPGRGMAATAIAGLLALATIATTPAAASAATVLKVRYPVNGSTFIKAANATVPLGPGALRSRVNLTTGAVTASLNLPPATGSFKAARSAASGRPSRSPSSARAARTSSSARASSAKGT